MSGAASGAGGDAGAPAPADPRFARVAVVGTSGAGKTVLARRLARLLGAPHVELDALHWGPGWTPAPEARFRARVTEALAGPRWVCDGNYRVVRDLVWARATAVVWLDYALPVVMGRVLARALEPCVGRFDQVLIDCPPVFGILMLNALAAAGRLV
ncbi:MAG: hypothetical protein R3263_04015, partial [Myxococcota bacterium]|nr:hypothetical protein [Myxococcota bacterium]